MGVGMRVKVNVEKEVDTEVEVRMEVEVQMGGRMQRFLHLEVVGVGKEGGFGGCGGGGLACLNKGFARRPQQFLTRGIREGLR